MTFSKTLREGIRRGEITCSVRIWTRPHVRVGARYRMEEGEIQVDSMQLIGESRIDSWKRNSDEKVGEVLKLLIGYDLIGAKFHRANVNPIR